MTDKQIMIDGVDVSKCEFYMHYDYGKFSHGCSLHKDMFGLPVCCDIADCCKDCYFKQLARKTAECEELKKELDKEHLLMLEKQDKATRYFLVINGIKEYIYNNTDFDVNDSIQSKTSGYDILQIIKDV